MSDHIRVVDLEVKSHIGVPDEERAKPQRLLVSVDLTVDCVAQAAVMDDITRTVNYYDTAQRVKKIAAQRPRKLIETLAEEIATDLLANCLIKKVTVEIKKFVITDAQYVSVKIERANEK